MQILSIKVFTDGHDHNVDFSWQSKKSDSVIEFSIGVPASIKSVDDIKSFAYQRAKELLTEIATDSNFEVQLKQSQ